MEDWGDYHTPIVERNLDEEVVMPATRRKATKKASTKKTVAKKPATKSPAKKRPSAARTPALGKRNHAKQVKERLHGAIRRTPQRVSETEFEATTAAVLAIVAELAAETAAVFGEVLARIDALERRLSR